MACRTPKLMPVITKGNTMAKEIDISGSIGSYARLVIKRQGLVLETTPPVDNDGSTVLSFATDLENLDEICVQVSCAAHFPGWIGSSFLKETCHIVPEPNLGFVTP